MITVQARLLENVFTSAQWAASNPILPDRVRGDDSTVRKYKIGDGVTHWNDLPYWNDYSQLTVNVPINTQLVDYGVGYAYRITAPFVDSVSVTVATTTGVNFVPYKAGSGVIDVYLPDYDGTGKTTVAYQITVGGVASSVSSQKPGFKSVATYAAMIADGTPTVATTYEVLADEDKSYTRSTYFWKPNGNREWLASTPDN